MASTSVGSIHYDLSIDSSKFDAAAGQIKQKTNTMSSGFDTLAKIGTGAFIAVGAAITAALVVNLGKAISRIDTLNNFPKVMTNLGYATEESGAAMKRLEAGVRGLPTSLDGIASAMQNIAPSSKNLDEATSLTLALNNALIAGGKSTAVQASAMEQFSQAIAKGKPDMMEWRTIATAMPGQLDQITQKLGYGRGEWQKMANDVTEGRLPFEKVKQAIVDLNTNGLGKFPSFAAQAKNASGGLQTAMANANTAIARGIANVINAIGSSAIATAISNFGSWIEKGLTSAANAFTAFAKFLQDNKAALWAFAGAATGLGIALAVALAPAIWGVVSAIGAAAVAAAPFILIGAALASIGYLIYTNWGLIAPYVQIVKDKFMEFWTVIAPLREFIVNQLITAWNNLKMAFELVRQALEPFMPQLKILGLLLLVAVVTPIMIVIGSIVLFIGIIVGVITAIAWFINKIAELGRWLVDLHIRAANAMAGFANAIISRIQQVQAWFAALPGNIQRGLGNLGGMLVGAGQAIINGLVQGISNGAGAVINKIKSIAQQSLNEVKRFFGIRSPSRLMAEQGNFIMKGLGVGIEKGAKAVVGTTQDAMTTIGRQLSAQQQIDMMISSGNSGTLTAAQAGALGGQTAVNTYVYGDTILNGETDQQKYLDRLAQNFVQVSQGAAT